MNVEQQYIDLFSQTEAMICKHSAEVLNAPRAAAFADFERLGFPTRKMEKYKYTDISKYFEPDYGLNLNRLQIPVNPYEVFKCDVPNMSTALYFVVNDAFYNKALPKTHLPEGVIFGSLKDICVRWYQSGEFPAQILNFAYNELASADKDAIIFMGGSLDLYGARMLQNAKDMFNDKKIIVYPFLSSFTYMDKLTEELGIPKYKEENNDTTGFISPTDFMKTYSKKIKRQVDYIIRHTNRPVYFSITMDELSRSAFKDCLHSEGLLMKYSPKSYDNLAIVRRNFENVYLMDYLRETFYPETVATVAFNPQLTEALSLYYVPALKALLQFYKESGDLNHYDKLYLLLKSVIDNAKSFSKEVREQYQKSINLQ